MVRCGRGDGSSHQPDARGLLAHRQRDRAEWSSRRGPVGALRVNATVRPTHSVNTSRTPRTDASAHRLRFLLIVSRGTPVADVRCVNASSDDYTRSLVVVRTSTADGVDSRCGRSEIDALSAGSCPMDRSAFLQPRGISSRSWRARDVGGGRGATSAPCRGDDSARTALVRSRLLVRCSDARRGRPLDRGHRVAIAVEGETMQPSGSGLGDQTGRAL
jgi:hypothetical protein